MNPLQRSLIEKSGHDNGFEYVVSSAPEIVNLASARHPNRLAIVLEHGIYPLRLHTSSPSLVPELKRSFPHAPGDGEEFLRHSEAELAIFMRRAAGLSRALPQQAAAEYQLNLAAELAKLPDGTSGTELERLVCTRVGQDTFRQAMLDYWGGACAVTGVALPAVLCASHAKPWAECASDGERLDVFNGFLLSANLDALFDRFLISFDEQGSLLMAPSLTSQDLVPLGIAPSMKLRWLDALHLPYLAFHRRRLGT